MNLKKFLESIKDYTKYFNDEQLKFYNELLETNEKGDLTENGKKILNIMQENEEKYFNVFSAKQIAELLFISPRSVSGSIRSLINKEYVEKVATSPVTYKLTERGKEYKIDNI